MGSSLLRQFFKCFCIALSGQIDELDATRCIVWLFLNWPALETLMKTRTTLSVIEISRTSKQVVASKKDLLGQQNSAEHKKLKKAVVKAAHRVSLSSSGMADIRKRCSKIFQDVDRDGEPVGARGCPF